MPQWPRKLLVWGNFWVGHISVSEDVPLVVGVLLYFLTGKVLELETIILFTHKNS